jgi:hypothetical protein
MLMTMLAFVTFLIGPALMVRSSLFSISSRFYLIVSFFSLSQVLVVVGACTFALGFPAWFSYLIALGTYLSSYPLSSLTPFSGVPFLYIIVTMLFYVDMNDPNPAKKRRRQQIQVRERERERERREREREREREERYTPLPICIFFCLSSTLRST